MSSMKVYFLSKQLFEQEYKIQITIQEFERFVREEMSVTAVRLAEILNIERKGTILPNISHIGVSYETEFYA